MEATRLLLQLEKLEDRLDEFSFDQLNTSEALGLREKFDIFKTDLSQKIFNEPFELNDDFLPKVNANQSGATERIQSPIAQMAEAIMRLKKTETSDDQYYLIESLELDIMVLTELTMKKIN